MARLCRGLVCLSQPTDSSACLCRIHRGRLARLASLRQGSISVCNVVYLFCPRMLCDVRRYCRGLTPAEMRSNIAVSVRASNRADSSASIPLETASESSAGSKYVMFLYCAHMDCRIQSPHPSPSNPEQGRSFCAAATS